MSLDWDLTKIENYKKKCWHETEDGKQSLNGLTETIIYMTMFIGINPITFKNIEEFYLRTFLHEKVSGPMRTGYSKEKDKFSPMYISWQDIVDHVGLTTNASSLTWAQFSKKLKGMAERQIGDAKRLERKKALDATANTDSDSNADRAGV